MIKKYPFLKGAFQDVLSYKFEKGTQGKPQVRWSHLSAQAFSLKCNLSKKYNKTELAMLFNDETLKEKRVYWFSKSILFDVVALPVHEILTAMSHIKSNSFLQDKKSFDWYKSAIMNGLNKSGTMGCHVVARTYFNKK